MADQKTIGQIAAEAYEGDEYSTLWEATTTDPEWRRRWEAAASAVWDQAVEACIAKLQEDVTIIGSPEFTGESLKHLASAIKRLRHRDCKALRSLKRSDKTESDNG